MAGGAWLLGLALVISTVVPMLNLDDWETGDAIWKAGIIASGVGLVAVLSAFAWRAVRPGDHHRGVGCGGRSH